MGILAELYIQKIIVSSVLVLGLCECEWLIVIFGGYVADLGQIEVSEQTICEISRYGIILTHKLLFKLINEANKVIIEATLFRDANLQVININFVRFDFLYDHSASYA